MKMPLSPEGRAFWEQVHKEDRDYQRGLDRVAMSPLSTPPLWFPEQKPEEEKSDDT